MEASINEQTVRASVACDLDGLDRSGLNHVGRLRMHSVRRPFDIPLDGDWIFRFEHESQNLARTVQVPSLWTMSGMGERPHYTNVAMPFNEVMPHTPAENLTGIYRRQVHSSELTGERCVLHVAAVEGQLRVYVNGRPIGSSSDSHLAAEFEVTHALVEGWNEIELRVSKWSSASYLEDQDQWWQFGIARSVGIFLLPAVIISDIAVNADWDGEFGTLELQVTADALAGEAESTHTVRATFEGREAVVEVSPKFVQPRLPPSANDRSIRPDARLPDGFRDVVSLAAAKAPLPPELRAIPMLFQHSSRDRRAPAGSALVEIARCEVQPWSAEIPQLYEVHIQLMDKAGLVADETTLRIGFRRVEIIGRDLLVNGKRVMIKGVNRHDFDPHTGRVISKERLTAELRLLKRHNFNAIRAAHYPNQPEFYDLCDEYGFYVVDEANVEGHAYASRIADRPEYLLEIVERVQRMVLRDRNHPSIILWSLGNETGYGAAHDAAAAWIRRTDPSRPLHYEGAIASDWHAGHSATDVVCPMYPTHSALEAFALDERADRPLIACEYAYSQGNSTGGLADYWRLFESMPGLQGGFIWQFADHGLDPDGDGRYRYGGDFGDEPNDGATLLNGLVLPDLTPKPALLEARGVFSPAILEADTSASGRSRIVVRNRQTFANLDRFDFQVWVETPSGSSTPVVLPLPETLPGQATLVDLPAEIRTLIDALDVLAITVRIKTSEETSWAPSGTEIALQQIRFKRLATEEYRPGAAVAVDQHGDLTHPLLLRAPKLCLWRALTDNDRSFALDQRFVRSGFFQLTRESTEVHAGNGETTVTTRYTTAFGDEITHRRTITKVSNEYVCSENVALPYGTNDGLRVGIEFELVAGFSDVSWIGLGPWENYVDRNSSALLGKWSLAIEDFAVPYGRPQENGTRGGTTELEISGAAGVITARSETPLHVNVSRYSVTELEDATHWWQLPPSVRTIVHLDVAHRGLGTALLGPDTKAEHRLSNSTYAWSWTLTLP